MPENFSSRYSAWSRLSHRLAQSQLLSGSGLEAALSYLGSFEFSRCYFGHQKWTQPIFKEKTLKDDIENRFFKWVLYHAKYFDCHQFATEYQVFGLWKAVILCATPSQATCWSEILLAELARHFNFKSIPVKNEYYQSEE